MASATSTVTSRSALRADFLRPLSALRAELGRLALALGLHALIDRLAVLLRQVGAPDAHVDHLDAVVAASWSISSRMRAISSARSSRTTWMNVASPSTRRSAELSRMVSCELAPTFEPSVW